MPFWLKYKCACPGTHVTFFPSLFSPITAMKLVLFSCVAAAMCDERMLVLSVMAPDASRPLNGFKGSWKETVERAVRKGSIRRHRPVPAVSIPQEFDSETAWLTAPRSLETLVTNLVVDIAGLRGC